MLNLGEIEARAAAATEGPWEWSMSGPNLETEAKSYLDVIDISHDHGCACRRLCELEVSVTDEDRTFIAHARTDVPALIARIRELEAENAKIDDLDEALRQRDREILGLRRDRDARDAQIGELEAGLLELTAATEKFVGQVQQW